MSNFLEWMKRKKLPQDVKNFISGKSDSAKVEIGKVATGHPKLDFRTGPHCRKKTRAMQKRKALKDQE